jgi:hypothetical protein
MSGYVFTAFSYSQARDQRVLLIKSELSSEESLGRN